MNRQSRKVSITIAPDSRVEETVEWMNKAINRPGARGNRMASKILRPMSVTAA